MSKYGVRGDEKWGGIEGGTYVRSYVASYGARLQRSSSALVAEVCQARSFAYCYLSASLVI